MKGKVFAGFLIVSSLFLSAAPGAMAIGKVIPCDTTGETTIGSTPDCPLITREEQLVILSNWSSTGSLDPAACETQPVLGAKAREAFGSGGYSPTTTSSCPTTSPSCPTGSSPCPTGPSSCPTTPSASCPTGSKPCQTGSPSCPQKPSSGATGGNYTPGSLSSQEQSLANDINGARTAQGLNPLPVDPELSAIARDKSKDMVDNRYFAHESPTKGRAADRLNAANYQYTSVGENIARAGDVDRANALLMSSPDHRRNILGSQWKKMGIGVVNDANGYPYVTELFVR